MKSNIKSNLIIIGILFALLPIITTNLTYVTDNNSKTLGYSDDFTLDKGNLKISDVSGKIHIDGNSGWAAFKADGNCTGSGTYSAPYVIEDLIINGGGSGNCILIENSDVYFEIENCTLYNSGGIPNAGIKLNNVTRGKLVINNCTANCFGILLDSCDNNTISGNTANINTNAGIVVGDDSIYNNISGNIANNNGGGILNIGGISLDGSTYNTITGNTANNNYDAEGIWLSYSDNNTITGNTVNNNYGGISLDGSTYNAISGNTANNNGGGIRISGGSHNNISGNTANNNNDGMYLVGSTYNTILGNTASHNFNGMNLGGNSSHNNIIGNNASFNGATGIKLYQSNYNTVSGNILIGNDECIVENNCYGNTFSDNGDCTYGQENPASLISGYSLIALLGVLSVVSIIVSKKLKKS